MGSGAHRNALAVDHGRDVMGMRALHLEGNHRSLAARGADQAQRVDFAQTLLGIGQKIVLVGGDALLADRIDVVDRSAQPDRLDLPDHLIPTAKGKGVRFEEYDLPGLKTVDGIGEIEGQYPSKGSGERGAWFRDSEGNMLGIGELVP